MPKFDPTDETYVAGSRSHLETGFECDSPRSEPDEPLPQAIGRYVVQSVLGQGGFGTVYLAQDNELHRQVAVKVPHRLMNSGETEAWLEEARMVAALDHEHIVPVYDVGRTDDGGIFMVSKYIHGMTLRELCQDHQSSYEQICRLILTIARALHFAHKQGVVHRDIKPANILIDHDGRPYLVDFGVALREGRIEAAGIHAGTPSFMSPEQARGEGHRVDGRSDVFSLGIVFYIMLTGRKPFSGANAVEVLQQIQFHEPRPPRQIDDQIPAELERICFRAIEKRATVRYSTAADFADDLQFFLDDDVDESIRQSGMAQSADIPASPSAASASTDMGLKTTLPEIQIPQIVPRGLRSFERNDADFFLHLLPGPRDRKGLPETLRFWKSRLEDTDSNNPFSVGLVYGPSGCGKSSLVKAGLLPILDDSIVPVYLEATRDRTEIQLLRALRDRLPAIPDSITLTEAMTGLRRGLFQRSNQSIVIVIDQLEQWLHVPRTLAECELVQALRQCDHENVRCLLMVRDDFWMSANRLMRELEIRIVEGKNSAAVDLFDLAHARRVLSAFGVAYGKLSIKASEWTSDQTAFLNAAVQSLATEGLVVSVRLTVFAEMMKHRPWTSATLSQFGGGSGLGVAFLEDAFHRPSTPPERKVHEAAARTVLQALLPASGSSLKGHRRTEHELIQLCGYENRPGDFEEVIGILDGSLRLISPADSSDVAQTATSDRTQHRSYQLSHDFLVESLRDWLTQQQRETRRGRAQLVLTERSEMWASRPETRQLPSFFEWSRILLWTLASQRTQREQQMVQAASRRHIRNVSTTALVLAFVLAGLFQVRSIIDRRHQNDLAAVQISSLLAADIEEVPELLDELHLLTTDSKSTLQEVVQTQDRQAPAALYASLALLPQDRQQVSFLVDRVTESGPDEVQLVSQRFLKEKVNPASELWTTVAASTTSPRQKLRVLGLLAQTDPSSDRWQQTAPFAAHQVVAEPTLMAAKWSQLLAPVNTALTQPLVRVFQDRNRSVEQRTNAVIVLAGQHQDDPEFLSELIVDTNPAQFAVVLPYVQQHREACVPLLQSVLASPEGPGWKDVDVSRFAATDAADQQSLRQGNGVLTPEFAFCQNMPLNRFRELATSLTEKGYRPICFRPYNGLTETLVAAVWTRDGRPWEINYGVSADALTLENQTKSQQQIWPVDVGHYQGTSSDQTPVDLFTAVWTPKWDDISDARMYVGVAEDQHAETRDALWNTGFAMKSNLKVRSVGRENLFSSVGWRLWFEPLRKDAWQATPDDYQQHQTLTTNWTQQDVRIDIIGAAEAAPAYTAAWWDGTDFETQEIHGVDLIEHLKQCDALQQDGYRPRCISVRQTPDGYLAASVWARPNNETHKDQVAAQKASAAITLAHLNVTDELWPLLRHQPDPRLRALLVDRFAAYSCPVNLLTDRLLVETDRTIRRALLVALADFDLNDLSDDQRTVLISFITQLFRTDDDAGVHGACELVFRRAGLELPPLEESAVARTPTREWMVDGHGHTLTIIRGPVEYQMGSLPQTRDRIAFQERLRKKVIPRSFAVATKEVTVEQFLRFREDFGYQKQDSREPDAPVNNVDWIEAVAYCRWLSEQENIAEDQMCFPPLNEIGMVPKAGETMLDFSEGYLSRTGYRLPTEAEWEYVCKSGTVTERYFGQTELLLNDHAWTIANSAIDGQVRLHPVGRLRPNDFGMFDMLGNVMEMCLTRHDFENEMEFVVEDGEDPVDLADGVYSAPRQLRGGAHLYQPSNARASHRDNYARPYSSRVNSFIGFRVARTLPSK